MVGGWGSLDGSVCMGLMVSSAMAEQLPVQMAVDDAVEDAVEDTTQTDSALLGDARPNAAAIEALSNMPCRATAEKPTTCQ